MYIDSKLIMGKMKFEHNAQLNQKQSAQLFSTNNS